MKKLAAMMILVASLCVGFVALANIPISSRIEVEFEYEALFSQSGEFKCCAYAGNDCSTYSECNSGSGIFTQ